MGLSSLPSISSKMSPTLELSAFPEEVLETVLSYCVVAPLSPAQRPSWHRPSASDTLPQIRGRLAPLLVSKKFCRISTPLFYHNIHIATACQLRRLLLDTLQPNPFLASHIRRIVLSGVWVEGGELFKLCGSSLRWLDFTLDFSQLASNANSRGRGIGPTEFCEGLKELTSLRHLVVRKPAQVYLTEPKTRYVMAELAKAVPQWHSLEHADIAFRLSDDSGSGTWLSPFFPLRPSRNSKVKPGPITELAEALSILPKLHTFSTRLPSVWNEVVLRVSANPALERIILVDGAGERSAAFTGRDFYAGPVSGSMPSGPTLEGGPGIIGTGLFFKQAKKHARLCELIRAGTSIMRTRAQTLGTTPTNTPPASPTTSQFALPSSTSSAAIPLHAQTSHSHPVTNSRAWEYYPPSTFPSGHVPHSPRTPPRLSTPAS